jgi:hypothetical protein
MGSLLFGGRGEMAAQLKQGAVMLLRRASASAFNRAGKAAPCTARIG